VQYLPLAVTLALVRPQPRKVATKVWAALCPRPAVTLVRLRKLRQPVMLLLVQMVAQPHPKLQKRVKVKAEKLPRTGSSG
jgi:hypothetical protein